MSNHFPKHCLYFIFGDMRVQLTGQKGSYIFYQRNTKRTKNILMFPVKDKDIDKSIKTFYSVSYCDIACFAHK